MWYWSWIFTGVMKTIFKKKKKKLHVSLVDGRIVKFRTRYETLDYFKEFGVIGIDLVDNSDLN